MEGLPHSPPDPPAKAAEEEEGVVAAPGQLSSAAYRITCPVCSAEPGHLCHVVRASSLKGRRKPGALSYQAHTDRLREARKATEERTQC